MFHSRVEGQFRRIVRHGDSPRNYWWEVTDKSGTRWRPGAFKMVTADPLRTVEVSLNGNLIRRYELNYEPLPIRGKQR